MAYTQKSSLSTDQVAFSQEVLLAYRAAPLHDEYATVRATRQTHRGSGVTFTKYADMAQATSALTETSDVTAVALSDSTVTLTLAEYGNAAITTAALRGQSFTNVDLDAAGLIAFNAVDSIDKVCADVAYADTTNVKYIGQTSRGALTASNTITSSSIREAVANLRSAAVPTFGANYIGLIHPDVAVDLIEQTGTADLRSFQIRSDAENVRKGEIGTFDGVTFISTPRALLVADGGASNVDAYGTLILGEGGIGKAFSDLYGPEPEVVFGPVTDTLRRFQPVGWYAMLAYGVIRGEALYRIESASSIGDN